MKITTTKIIRELEKKGYKLMDFTYSSMKVIEDVRDIIDEILKEQKGITIKK
jgi:hypothetical protein